jgi:hypothetical protein
MGEEADILGRLRGDERLEDFDAEPSFCTLLSALSVRPRTGDVDGIEGIL